MVGDAGGVGNMLGLDGRESPRWSTEGLKDGDKYSWEERRAMTVGGSMSPTISPVTGGLERETVRYYKDRNPMEDPAVRRRKDER